MKKGLTKKLKNVTIDDLAIMVQQGFNELGQRIESLDVKIDDVENRLEEKIDGVEKRLTGRIAGLERRMDDIVYNFSTREEMKKMDVRVSKIERKVGI